MIINNKYCGISNFFLGIIFLITVFSSSAFSSELYVNVLVVNGADVMQNKNISQQLPKELNKEDVLDTNGLKLKYDVDKGRYVVYGNVNLNPKESKTFKVRIKDVWRIESGVIDEMKQEIEVNLSRLENTEYYKTGLVKKNILLDRLNFIENQQKKFSNNIEKRIGRHRIYKTNLFKIRRDVVSVQYWKSAPPKDEVFNIFPFIIEINNPSEYEDRVVSPKHYLPQEVKPEHFLDLLGFQVRYDSVRGRIYLQKEEKLKAGEKKRYEIEIIDIWNIKNSAVKDLRVRTKNAVEFLALTEYKESAEYLAKSIYKNLKEITLSQKITRSIVEHIGNYRKNKILYDETVKEVEDLERLLEAIREEMEDSTEQKDILQKISTFKSLVKIIETIFKKPSENTAWKIIKGVIIFVGIYTVIHFLVWAKRSANLVIKEEEKDDNEE